MGRLTLNFDVDGSSRKEDQILVAGLVRSAC